MSSIENVLRQDYEPALRASLEPVWWLPTITYRRTRWQRLTAFLFPGAGA